MSPHSISVDRLEIRLKGISADSARAAVSGLGGELVSRLASDCPQVFGARDTNHLDAGSVTMPVGAAPSELRASIAARVSASINRRTAPLGRED